MTKPPYLQNLIEQAVVGTDQSILDLSLLPEHLRFKIHMIRYKAKSNEEAFLEILAFLEAEHMLEVDDLPEVNSFSIRQMRKFNKFYQNKIKKHASLKVRIDAKNPEPIESIANHEGPLPLIVLPFDRPEFPKWIGKLTRLIKEDETHTLSYYLFNKLIPYDMQFGSECTNDLVGIYLSPYVDRTGWPRVPHSMVQHAILKLSNQIFRIVLLKSVPAEGKVVMLAPTSVGGHFWLDFSREKFDCEESLNRLWEMHKSGLDCREYIVDMFAKYRWENKHLSRTWLVQKVKEHLVDKDENNVGVIADLILTLFINFSYMDTSVFSCLDRKRMNALCGTDPDMLVAFANFQVARKRTAALLKCFDYFFEDEDSKPKHDNWMFDDFAIKHLRRSNLKFMGVSRPFMLNKVNFETKDNFEVIDDFIGILINGAKWEECLALTDDGDTRKAILRWLVISDKKDDDGYSVVAIGLAKSIVRARDADAARVLLDLMVDGIVACPVYCYVPLLKLLDVEQRLQYLKRIPLRFRYSNEFDYKWLIEPEVDPLEFKPIDDRWGLVLLGATKAVTLSPLALTFFGMYLSSDSIDWCNTQLAKLKGDSSRRALKIRHNLKKVRFILRARDKIDHELKRLAIHLASK